MDLQQMLAAVEFSESKRGYEPSEVRSFLSEVSRGVADIERRNIGGNDDEVRRTLVLAQRAADAAVAEAKEEAQRILSAAQDRARRMLADAEAHVTETRSQADREAVELVSAANTSSMELVTAAEVEARRGGDELRANMREQVAHLGDQRARLAADITALEGQLDAQRRRMASAIDTLQLLLDNPDMLGGMEEVDIEDLEMVDDIEYTGMAPQMMAPVSAPLAAATQMNFDSVPDMAPAAAMPASDMTPAAEVIDLTEAPPVIDLREPTEFPEPLVLDRNRPDGLRPDSARDDLARGDVRRDEPTMSSRPMTKAERFADVLENHRDPITAEIPVIAGPAIVIDGGADDAELLRRFLDAEPDDAGRWRRRRR
jgi:vacuolar-type H+-ATPase subunit H